MNSSKPPVLALASDWPPAYEWLNPQATTPLVLLCEHASNHIPTEYARLGLAEAELERHIAWDIGAARLTRCLAARLQATALLGSYSRLLIDLNRPLAAPDSIATQSEDTEIPGNAGLAETERARRANHIFLPYHAQVTQVLDAHAARAAAQGERLRLLTIHSFTPVYRAIARPWHAGVLFGQAESFGLALLASLQGEASLQVGANVPYQVRRASDYAIPRHGDDRGIEAAMLEIRQDQLNHDTNIASWCERIALAYEAAIEQIQPRK